MIVSKFEDLHRYDSLNPLFKKAFDWILNTDFSSLNLGKVTIDGENLFANVQEYSTRSISESFFEAHRKYTDIQFLISGEEKIDWSDTGSLNELAAYNSESDFHKLSGEAKETVKIGNGIACILFPEDAHMPCLCMEEGKKEKVRKICMKIKI